MDNEPTTAGGDRRSTRRRGVARSPPAPLDVAYRMLGSISDAEDAVQEAFARLVRNGVDGIDDVRGWLVVVVSRLCLDQLRSAQSQRTSYVGPWMPEPVVDVPSLGVDPADRVTLDDSVRMALLVVLEQLYAGRAHAFVLHDVFQLVVRRGGVDRRPVTGGVPAAREPRPAPRPGRSRAEPVPRRRRPSTSGSPSGSSPRRTAATSRRCSRCSTPTSSGDADSGGVIPGAPRHALVGRSRVAANLLRNVGGRGSSSAPWMSTANPVSSACRTGGSSPRSCSRAATG